MIVRFSTTSCKIHSSNAVSVGLATAGASPCTAEISSDAGSNAADLERAPCWLGDLSLLGMVRSLWRLRDAYSSSPDRLSLSASDSSPSAGQYSGSSNAPCWPPTSNCSVPWFTNDSRDLLFRAWRDVWLVGDSLSHVYSRSPESLAAFSGGSIPVQTWSSISTSSLPGADIEV